MAILAISQIKSRKLVNGLGRGQSESLVTLRADFPDALIPRRANAKDILLVGMTMSRTVQGLLGSLPTILRDGGRVRVLILDPTDATRPNGLVSVQHYEFQPDREAAPIMVFDRRDEPWFSHFATEAERLWKSGTTWPLSRQSLTARKPRPQFSEEFDTTLDDALDGAKQILITGFTRNGLLMKQFTKFERRLKNGQELKFLLVNPDSNAVDIAAERYYTQRSGPVARERINSSLKLLADLKRLSGGKVDVRVTAHPLAVGVIATDPDEAEGTLFLEYYTFQAPGEPKFIMQSGEQKHHEKALERMPGITELLAAKRKQHAA